MDFNKHIQRVISVLFMFQNRQRWRNRRSQRLDKMELLTLQSSLQSEIQAKSQIAEELSNIKSACVGYEKLVIQNIFFIFDCKLLQQVLCKKNVMSFIVQSYSFHWLSNF